MQTIEIQQIFIKSERKSADFDEFLTFSRMLHSNLQIENFQ